MPGPQPPYGWRWNERGKLRADPEEQAVIAILRAWRAQGWSIQRCTLELHARGVRNRAGNPFDSKRIWKICKREGLVALPDSEE